MGSITLYDEKGKLVFYDSGHTHKKLSSYHVHEVDLSKLTLSDLEKIERDSREGWIDVHDWKSIPGALTERDATSEEIEYIERMRKY